MLLLFYRQMYIESIIFLFIYWLDVDIFVACCRNGNKFYFNEFIVYLNVCLCWRKMFFWCCYTLWGIAFNSLIWRGVSVLLTTLKQTKINRVFKCMCTREMQKATRVHKRIMAYKSEP